MDNNYTESPRDNAFGTVSLCLMQLQVYKNTDTFLTKLTEEQRLETESFLNTISTLQLGLSGLKVHDLANFPKEKAIYQDMLSLKQSSESEFMKGLIKALEFTDPKKSNLLTEKERASLAKTLQSAADVVRQFADVKIPKSVQLNIDKSVERNQQEIRL